MSAKGLLPAGKSKAASPNDYLEHPCTTAGERRHKAKKVPAGEWGAVLGRISLLKS